LGHPSIGAVRIYVWTAPNPYRSLRLLILNQALMPTTAITLDQALLRAIHRLNQEQKQHLLAFIEVMVPPEDKSHPSRVLKLSGSFPKEDLQEMRQIIKEGDKIDYDEW